MPQRASTAPTWAAGRWENKKDDDTVFLLLVHEIWSLFVLRIFFLGSCFEVNTFWTGQVPLGKKKRHLLYFDAELKGCPCSHSLRCVFGNLVVH